MDMLFNIFMHIYGFCHIIYTFPFQSECFRYVSQALITGKACSWDIWNVHDSHYVSMVWGIKKEYNEA